MIVLNAIQIYIEISIEKQSKKVRDVTDVAQHGLCQCHAQHSARVDKLPFSLRYGWV